MSGIGGPIESVGIGGRVFAVAQDADSSRKLGGKENTIAMNGDGTGRKIETRVAWNIGGVMLSIDDAAGDHQYLQDIADQAEYVSINVTYASGAVFGGLGTIVDEVTVSSANTTASVALSGPGRLVQQ